MVLLGVLAVRSGQGIDINPSTGEILGGSIPTEWIRPTYRSGWSL
jgi:hypothetical protein